MTPTLITKPENHKKVLKQISHKDYLKVCSACNEKFQGFWQAEAIDTDKRVLIIHSVKSGKKIKVRY
jgi:hypothetical protein